MKKCAFLMILACLALPGTALAVWTDCPGAYAGTNCNDPGWTVCSLSGPDIVCDFAATNTRNLIYVVTESSVAYAYGTYDLSGTPIDFCCQFNTFTDVKIWGGIDTDLVCLTDDNVHHCSDNDGGGTQVFSGDSYISTGEGADRIDTAVTGAHVDTVLSGSEDDLVSVYDGDDFVSCGSGDDVASGGDGADAMCGGTDADELYGNAGPDCLCHEDPGTGPDGSPDFLAGQAGVDEGYWYTPWPDYDTDDGSITMLEECDCACP
jgi:hypothetical protein